jgi:voltage-gated potassium channel
LSRSLRARLHGELDPTCRAGLSLLNRLIVVAIIASVALAVLETEPHIARRLGRPFWMADVVLTTLFLLEYAVRLWTAPENPRFAHPVFGRLRWAATPAAVIDLLALVPALVFVGATPAYLFRLVRLLRILRLARLGRFSKAWGLVSQALHSRREELLVTLAAAGLAMLTAATLLHLVEGSAQPEEFGSIPRALWWAVVTLTTIGYGDVYPVTVLGKVLAGITAVTGIGLIAAPTGILAAAFSDAVQSRREEVREED